MRLVCERALHALPICRGAAFRTLAAIRRCKRIRPESSVASKTNDCLPIVAAAIITTIALFRELKRKLFSITDQILTKTRRSAATAGTALSL